MSVEERKALIEKLNKRFARLEGNQLATVDNVITGMELQKKIDESEKKQNN